MSGSCHLALEVALLAQLQGWQARARELGGVVLRRSWPEVVVTLPEDVPAVALRVRELHGRGLDDEAIGADLGISARSAKRIRHSLGLLRAPSPHDLVPDARLRELHAHGLHNGEISDATGLTRRTVQERLHRLGLASHPAPRVARPTAPRDQSIAVRWTEAEVIRVRDAAEAAGLEISEYVRRRVLG